MDTSGGIGHLADFTAVEDVDVVSGLRSTVVWDARHARLGLVENHGLIAAISSRSVCQVLSESIRQTELKQHPSAEIKRRLRVVEVNHILRKIAFVVRIALCRLVQWLWRRHLRGS